MATTPRLDVLRELLAYDSETGEFRNRVKRSGVRFGGLAGTINSSDGLRYIRIDGRRHAAQRLAWLYIHGVMPKEEVGFKDPTLPSSARERLANLAVVVPGALTADDVRKILHYDAKTGIFTYRASRKSVTAGKRAGSVEPNGYRFIGFRGERHPAQRLAWLYVYGEWPDGAVRFRNNDRDDCRIENLYQPDGYSQVPELRYAHAREDRKNNPAKYRRYDIRKKWGHEGEVVFARLFAEQNGVCASCGEPETAMRNGKVKALAMDHDHALEEATGELHVRGLLCGRCNPLIGFAKDDTARMHKAIAYMERVGIVRSENVITLPKKKDSA